MADEWTAKIYWQDYQVPSIGVRPFFVYGPARDQGMSSHPDQGDAGRGDRPPLQHLRSAARRLYQHAEDVANVIIRASKTRAEGAPCYNLGGSKATIDDVIDAIERRRAGDGRQDHRRARACRPSRKTWTDPPLESAIGKVEWRDFNDGVKGTIDFFRAAVAAGKLDVERAIS